MNLIKSIIKYMPICKNNSKKKYTGLEPSPKGLGYCASGEKEGTIMKGNDGNQWFISNGKWIKKDNTENIKKELDKKLYNWWSSLSKGNIIVIYKDGSDKLIKSNMITRKAKIKDIKKMWLEFDKDDNVKVIIWSAQSVDTIQSFIDYLIEKISKKKIQDFLKMKDFPSYLLENYKKYFIKYEFYSKKDYILRNIHDK